MNPKLKPKDLIAKDLRTPKYRMRVVPSFNSYNRNRDKNATRKEINGYDSK